MYRLSHRAPLLSVVSALFLGLATAGLAGCTGSIGPALTGTPGSPGAHRALATAATTLFVRPALSDTEAEAVIAQAVAAHEMNRQ